ncbi:hypothetical protein NQ318_006593 [Aromia moschata]|uniref:Uncharacterized protein n=1 Tax=Aromia moschata TaxID=1265417 RepID=A0AAV8XWW2_9CUCU|nr:hypothetical protein NQ318_006593 [Aromia moschata]
MAAWWASYNDVLKQSRKEESDGFENPDPTSPTLAASSPAIPWPNKGASKSVVRHGSASDCTSMSGDSRGSRHLAMNSQRTGKPRSSNPLVSQSSPVQQLQPHLQEPLLQVQVPMQQSSPQMPSTGAQFLETPQYVAAIPVQPMIQSINFHSPTLLSPLPQVDNLVMSTAQSQLQADLQRKNAELQAIIGQQQQELRRVSEQLLMARLGLLPGSQPQPMVTNIPISYQGNTAGTVSSTTTTVQGLPGPMAGAPSVIVPVSVPISLPLQQNLIYNVPDSNTQSK